MIEETLNASVLWLALSRPQAANALDQATHLALSAALERAGTDPSIAAVVLEAAGQRAFCAGADLKEFSTLPIGDAALMRRDLLLLTLNAMLDFPKPLLACVQAPAVGAGAMLALACDEIVMAEHAWMSFPEIALNMPSPMGAAMIAHRASRSTVQRLVQAGERLGARQALNAGLVDEVADGSDLRSCCARRAGDRAARAGHAYAVNKKWINRELRAGLARAAQDATDHHEET